jgi:hypothetical protein
MSSYTLVGVRQRNRQTLRRETLRYGVVIGAIIAGAIYLFTTSATMNMAYTALGRALKPAATTVERSEDRPAAIITLSERPPEALP